MKNLKHIIASLWSITMINGLNAQLADINYTVRFNNITSYEGGVGGACWESGNEEYTMAYMNFYDNVNGAAQTVAGCQQCNNNSGSCIYGTAASSSRTNNAYTVTIYTDAYEDDGGTRCSYDSGDDCRYNGSVARNIREIAFPSNGTMTNSTFGNGSHSISYGLSWKYSGTANAISPTCQQQSSAYSSGGIRSWPAYLVAGKTYRFGTCGSTVDTYIRIFSGDGFTNVANFDDNGPLCNPSVAASGDYTPSSSGWYYIEVALYSRAALTAGGTLTYEDITPAPGNPATFGNGVWNVYGYNGGNINLTGEYAGYYTEASLSYNSTNRWANSPSDASGWQGCYVPVDNHVVVSKRTNFACGIYQLDIPLHDDDIVVYVNGTQVFTHVGCCDNHTNIWTGYLTAASTIEVRHLEGVGGSNQGLTITNVPPPTLNGGSVNSGGNTSVSICTGTNLPIFSNGTSPSGGTIGVVNGSPASPTYQWEQSPNGSSGWVNVIGGSGANTLTYDPPAISTLTYYRRKVTDACGTVAYSNTIQVSVTPAISGSASAGTISCNGGTTTLTVTASGGTGSLQYSLNGGTYQAGNTFTVNAAGSPYTVTVKDANNCTATLSAVTVTQPTAISGSASAGTISCNGGTTTLTVTASGGTGSLQYSLNGGTYQAGNTFTVNAAGSPYTVTVKDANNCTATLSPVTVTQPTAISGSASAGTISCNGGTTTLTVTANGGTGSLQYSLNGGTYQAGNTFTVNAAGSPYTVTVKDANNCTATLSAVTVTQPTAISGSASAGTISCNGGTTTLTVTASGGTGSLQYSLNGGTYQAGNTFTVNAAGSPYTVTVKDANNCTATLSAVTVTQPTAISGSASAGTISCNGGTTTLTVTASGGTGSLQYSLNGGTYQAGNTFTVNAAGSPYTVTVKDANNCTATLSAVTVTQPTAISGSASAGTISCNGGTTTLTVTASGGTGSLQYSLNGGTYQAGNTFTVNAAGSPYTVTVKDANNCTATLSPVTVTQPTAISGSASAGTISCNGGTTTLTVTANGGTGSLQYSLNGGTYQAGNTFTVNAAGSPYTVTVKDANNCTATLSAVTVTQPTAISGSASAGTISCNGGTTTLTVTANGGTGSLQYSLNGGTYQAGNTFTVNAAGSPYTVTVKDANNCTATLSAVTVTQPTAISGSASAGTISCNGGTTTLTVTANGGTGSLQYSLNGGTYQAGNTFTVNAAGSPYTVTVKDANNCTATLSAVTVTQPTAISGSASAGTISCNGGTTTLTVTANGGTGSLQYSLNGGTYQAGNTFTVNAAGSPYTVTVKDANNCTATLSAVTVTQPTAISGSASAGTISCNGGTTTLTVTASGGTGSLQYSLNGGTYQAGNTFTVNAAGSPYTVTVKDANNCTATLSAVTVTQPTAISGSASAGTISCNGGTTTLTVTASGGTGSLQYSLNGGTYQAGNTFTVNAAGSPYTVTVKDANNCTATLSAVTVTQPTAISGSASAGTISCNGGTTTLTVTASGGTGSLQYSLNGGTYQAGNTFTVNAAGSPYTVTVKDANNCTATLSAVTVTQPTALLASTCYKNDLCQLNQGELSVQVTGGTAPYTISWAPPGGTPASPITTSAAQTIISGLAGGTTYTITVTDTNGCNP